MAAPLTVFFIEGPGGLHGTGDTDCVTFFIVPAPRC